MKRRTYLAGLLAAGLNAQTPKTQAKPAGKTAPRPIQLHVDLAVDPKREQEMLDNFERIFRPVAMRQPGYIDLKMLKLRSAIEGPAPAGGKYRFELTFESEELRQKWIKSKDHDRAWPEIEKTLMAKKFGILLYEIY